MPRPDGALPLDSGTRPTPTAITMMPTNDPMALAAKKPPVVIVPSHVIADPTAKICMPRSTSPLIAKDKSLPETLCETVAAWAAHGVTIRAQ